MPQENGNRLDTRWLWTGDKQTQSGLAVKVESHGGDKNLLFGFKISDEKDLGSAKHPYQIKRGGTILRVDFAQHGLGTDHPGTGASRKIPTSDW